MFEKIKTTIAKIKNERPLILNITNDVTMDFIANGLLSLGASPVMSKAQDEIDDLLQLSNSVVMNIGTLNDEFIALCEYVCSRANQLKKPIILDPVGAGSSAYRTNTILNLINNYDIAIMRGNASEIISLTDVSVKSKGVDSTVQSHLAVESAQRIAVDFNMTVVVSGEVDFIVDVNNMQKIQAGSFLMSQVTGMGCLLTAVIGAFHAVEINSFDACLFATKFYGKCGEKASEAITGPSSFKIKFIDELNLMPDEFAYEDN